MDERDPLVAAQRRASRAEALAADYAMAMDVLGRLAGVTTERGVAEIVLEFAQTLIGSQLARMSVYGRSGRTEHVWERDRDGAVSDIGECPRAHAASDRELRLDVDGMSVPVLVGERSLGRIDMEALAYPDAVETYGDTVWIVARVAGMALENLRAIHGLVPICASCKAMPDADGTWQPVERWLRENADVLPSHGLCPACFRAAQLDAGLADEELDELEELAAPATRPLDRP